MQLGDAIVVILIVTALVCYVTALVVSESRIKWCADEQVSETPAKYWKQALIHAEARKAAKKMEVE
jgi:Mn2+/Fe2+ NRAMP family transporter